jgi:hypothetical protein
VAALAIRQPADCPYGVPPKSDFLTHSLGQIDAGIDAHAARPHVLDKRPELLVGHSLAELLPTCASVREPLSFLWRVAQCGPVPQSNA